MLLTVGVDQSAPEMMTAWGEWQTSVAGRNVHHGGFVRGREISRPGAQDLSIGAEAITGYCVIKAENFEEAEAIAGRYPFVTPDQRFNAIISG